MICRTASPPTHQRQPPIMISRKSRTPSTSRTPEFFGSYLAKISNKPFWACRRKNRSSSWRKTKSRMMRKIKLRRPRNGTRKKISVGRNGTESGTRRNGATSTDGWGHIGETGFVQQVDQIKAFIHELKKYPIDARWDNSQIMNSFGRAAYERSSIQSEGCSKMIANLVTKRLSFQSEGCSKTQKLLSRCLVGWDITRLKYLACA